MYESCNRLTFKNDLRTVINLNYMEIIAIFLCAILVDTDRVFFRTFAFSMSSLILRRCHWDHDEVRPDSEGRQSGIRQRHMCSVRGARRARALQLFFFFQHLSGPPSIHSHKNK